MSPRPALSILPVAKLPRKRKKKLNTSTRGQSLAFYNACVATIPKQYYEMKRIRGYFLELPGGTLSRHTPSDLVTNNLDAEVRNQIYTEYVEECIGPCAWKNALEFGNTCKQVRAEFLPLFISSLEKLWFRLDQFTELLSVCCSPISVSFIVDELVQQKKTFKITIDDYQKFGVRSILHMVMQLRERPSMRIRFKDVSLRTTWSGGTCRQLNHIVTILRHPVGPDDILSDIERLEIKPPGIYGACFSPREVSVPLNQGWFLEITFKTTLGWWDNDGDRKDKVWELVRHLGLSPVTASFMGISHMIYKKVPGLCKCTAGSF
jgi:hypothetical protein